MTITPAGAIPPSFEPSSAGRRSGAGEPGFMVPPDARSATPDPLSASHARSSPISASAMLALQEQPGGDASLSGDDVLDREARRQGQEILEALAVLQRDLLAAGGLDGCLARLSDLLDTPARARDPALAHVLGAIRLRARLEILRLTGSAGSMGLTEERSSMTGP